MFLGQLKEHHGSDRTEAILEDFWTVWRGISEVASAETIQDVGALLLEEETTIFQFRIQLLDSLEWSGRVVQEAVLDILRHGTYTEVFRLSFRVEKAPAELFPEMLEAVRANPAVQERGGPPGTFFRGLGMKDEDD